MFHYSGFGLSIHSEIELPGLPPGGDHADVVIRLGRVTVARTAATMDQEVAIHELAGRFHISDGREIVVDPMPGVDPAILRVVVAGRMMAFLLRQLGWLPLHASGIEVGGKAILFLGASGIGKSTTAAAFHSRGHHVITDDVAAVQAIEGRECVLRPAGPWIRLLEDSRSVFGGTEPAGFFQWDKHVFDLSRGGSPDLLPVRIIYVLADGDALGCEGISALSAAAELSRNSFVRHWRMGREALSAHIRDCASVASTVPVYRLIRPRSLAWLPEVVRRVEREVEGQAEDPVNRDRE